MATSRSTLASVCSANLGDLPPEAMPEIGERVFVGKTRLQGAVRYRGNPSFASGEWLGIELDTKIGKNDGSVNGTRYFTCHKEGAYGIFVRPSAVARAGAPPPPEETQRGPGMGSGPPRLVPPEPRKIVAEAGAGIEASLRALVRETQQQLQAEMEALRQQVKGMALAVEAAERRAEAAERLAAAAADDARRGARPPPEELLSSVEARVWQRLEGSTVEVIRGVVDQATGQLAKAAADIRALTGGEHGSAACGKLAGEECAASGRTAAAGTTCGSPGGEDADAALRRAMAAHLAAADMSGNLEDTLRALGGGAADVAPEARPAATTPAPAPAAAARDAPPDARLAGPSTTGSGERGASDGDGFSDYGAPPATSPLLQKLAAAASDDEDDTF